MTRDHADAALFQRSPYDGDRLHLDNQLAALTAHHYRNCPPYRNILAALNVEPAEPRILADWPPLPAGLFKRLDLLSVPSSAVTRVLTSSGTSRAARSRVFLDRDTSIRQMRALGAIVSSLIGEARLPLLIIDAPRRPPTDPSYEGRLVALSGFSMFGTGITFALNEAMELDLHAIDAFSNKVSGRPFLLFGFTYIVWRFFLEAIAHARIDLSGGILIHGGGWKRLAYERITDETFRDRAYERARLVRVHDYYGMVEQPGSIYLQCERGYLHCSRFSDLLFRRPRDLSLADPGEPGIIQTVSLLPRSYPGHNLLTEDLGTLYGEDDCGCGRRGKYFRVTGRMEGAEPKGCGDTHPL